MNQCNITQNRVKEYYAGYLTETITSDSFITCVNSLKTIKHTAFLIPTNLLTYIDHQFLN